MAFRSAPAGTTTTTSQARADGGSLRVVHPDTAEADYEVLVSQTSVDRRLLQGPFASHVWGGRYEIERFAGEGSQGATFVGTDRKTGARVALKLFDLGKAKDWKAAELFEREVATLKRLSHKGIPQFLDVIADDSTGARALVMTHVAGDSLGQLLKAQGGVPEKRLWSFLVDAAHVLAAVHGEGVVHRDLKPDNFIVRPDGSLAIVDFGGVGNVRGQAGSTVVGTFGFMAPEQLYGAQTPATDLYALGATMLNLATNKSPEDLPRKGLAIDVDAAAPFLSVALRTLLTKLLSPDPDARPKDGAALLMALKEVAATKTAGASSSSSSSSSARAPDEVLNRRGQRGPVEAIWREEDVEDALQATTGVLGIAASAVGLFAAVGVGRIFLPLLLTLISAFVSGDDRRKLHTLRDGIMRRSIEAQRLLENQARSSALNLDALSQRQRERHGRPQSRRERRDAARAQAKQDAWVRKEAKAEFKRQAKAAAESAKRATRRRW